MSSYNNILLDCEENATIRLNADNSLDKTLTITATNSGDGDGIVNISSNTINLSGATNITGDINISGNLNLPTNIVDSNNNELLTFSETDSAVNEFTISNNTTGNNPILSATGDDTNIGIDFQTKGSGSYHFKSTSSQASKLILYEDTDAGSNTVSITIPNLSNSYSLTLPTTDGTDGQVLSTNGSGTLTWEDQSSGGSSSLEGLSDVTITSADTNDILTYSGGAWVDSNSLSLGGTLDVVGDISINSNTIFNESSGTVTLSNIDAIDSTTEATLESAIDSLSNLTTVGTITTGTWNGTTIGVPYGGTGQTSLTANSLLTGNGTSGIVAEGNLTFDGSTLTVTGDIGLGDDNNLYVGSSNDLTIVHNGTNTIMTSATGNLVIDNTNATGSIIFQLGTDDTDTNIQILNNSGSTLVTFDSTGIDIATGDTYQINGTTVLSNNTLGSGVLTSSLTTVGTLDSGSISSGFGNIDVGTSSISGGSITGSSLTLTGDIDLTSQATDIDLIDNNSSALSFDSSGKTGILNIITTDSSEGVSMSGTLDVVGNISVNSNTIFSESGGTVTLSNIDAIDATTEATLESAIDSLVNLTTVGTITTGTWNGTTIGVQYGGTGQTSLTSNSVLTGNGTSGITSESNLTFDGSILTLTGDLSISSNIVDTNGNEYIIFSETSSAVNEFTITNNSTGNNPIFSVSGDDANIGIDFQTKGSGSYHFKSTSSQATTLVLYEDTDDGSNTISISVPTLGSSYSLILPTTDGDSGQVLQTNGTGTLSWADASSGSLFGLSDVTITSADENDILTYSGGAWVDSNSLSLGGTLNVVGDISINSNTIFSESSGTVTLSNIDAIDSTTEATLESAIDSLTNLTTVGTITTGTWNGTTIGVPYGGTGQTSLTSNAILTGNGTSGIVAEGNLLFDGSDLTLYEAINDGNPTLAMGSSQTEAFVIQSEYDSGAQTLDKITFTTYADSVTADKGKYEFYVDESLILTVDDDGLNLASGKEYEINGTSVLSNNTLGSGVLTSSLTTVGTLDSGAISSGFGNIDIGSSSITGGDITGSSLTLTGDIDLTGQATDIDLVDNNSSALSFDSTGKTGILNIITTNDSEGVSMSGTLDVVGDISINSNTIFSESSGTVTLSNIDAIDSTTEATLESAIDSLTNLTTVGTITTGTWNGTTIGVPYGGTGQTSLTANSLLTGNGTSGIVAEGNLTFDGSTLTLTGDFSISSNIVDTNGNEYIIFSETSSAVNEFTITNNSTGNNPIFSVSGDDANIGVDFQTKGTGTYNFKSTSSQATTLVLYEDTDDGSNTVSITVPTLSSSYSLTLPVDDGGSGQVLQTNGSGVLSWADASSGSLSGLSDVTITSADENDILTYSGGAWIDSNSLSLGGTLDVVGDISINSNTIFSESGGTVTLSNIDAIDSTTEATLESAIDSLVNLTIVGTITTGTWNGDTITVPYGGTGQTSLTSNAILTGNGTSGIVAEGNLLFDGSDLTLYEAVNDGNPTIALGSSQTEAFVIQSEYDSGAQTLDKITFTTYADSATADKGKYEFYVDESLILTIDDDGLNLASGKEYEINGTSVLSNNTLGTGVLTSSLTTVGTLDSGAISSGFGNIDVGSSTITGGFITGTRLILTGDINLTGQATDIDLLDNQASALSFDVSSRTGLINISTLNSNEGVSIAGYLDVEDDIRINGNSIFSESGGTVTLTNIDAIDSTTEATLESAIDSLTNLTAVGTITTGTWNGTTIGVPYGGTGQTSLTANSLLTGNGTSGIVAEGNLTFDGSILTLTGDFSISSNIVDTNGNEYIIFSETASAVNEFTIINNATGSNPILSVSGDDANIGVDFQTKGTGTYNFKSTSSQATMLVLYEDTDNGSNTVSITVPALDSSYSLTLPVDDGGSGQVLQTNGSGVLSWADASSGSLAGLSDVTITSADENDILIYSGGAWIDSNSLSLGGTLDVVGDISINSNTIFSESSGTVTLSNIDAIDATTEATLESAIDSLVNLTTVGTITTGTWNGDTIGVEYGGTGQTSLTSNAILTGNGTSGIIAEGNLLFNGSDLTLYEAVNDGNPAFAIGSSQTEAFVIQSEYDSGAQTLDKVTISTYANSATADKGKYEFYVDESLILTIDDDGLNLASGKEYEINGTSVLSNNTLGSGVLTSSLTTVGTLDSGAISSGFGNIDIGSSSITGGDITGSSLTLTGDIDLTGQATDIDLVDNNSSALSFDSTGKVGILNIITTDDSEGVSMSGTLDVVGDISINSNTIFSESGGTVTLSNIDAIDATTEATLESAIDSLVNLTTVGTITTGTWNGDTIGVEYGGTGQTSLTANSVLTGNGTSGIVAEGNLTFDGSILTLTGDLSISSNIVDTNGNEYVVFSETSSAVNEFTIINNSTGNNPIFSVSGDDANIGVDFQTKGTGTYNFKSTSSQATTLVLYEDTDDGSNTVSITVPTLSSSYSLTLPVDDGGSGQVLQTNGSGVLSWADASSGSLAGLSDVTITSADENDILVYSGGAWVDSNSLSLGGTLDVVGDISINSNTIFSESSGTVTLSNIDAIDSTTEATLESAIDSLVNLTTVGTITTGTWNGTTIGVAYGGTGQTSLTANSLLTGNGTSGIVAEGNLTFDGSILTLTGDLSISSSIVDTNGNEYVVFSETSSAVNEFTITNNSTGNNPIFSVSGDDANIGIDFQIKGSGSYHFKSTSSQASTIILYEDTDDGSNTVSITVPALGSSYSLTLPVDDGDDGEVLTTNGSGVLSWGSAGGGSLNELSDVTITSADENDILTYSGGAWIDSNSLSLGGTLDVVGDISINSNTIFSESSGTVTLSNIDAIDSTTEATLESAIDSLPNLTTVGSITTGTWNGDTITVPYGGTGQTSLTSNAILTGNGTSGIVAEGNLLFDGSDLTLYEAVNDGNPIVAIGSSSSEGVIIQSVFDSGAQTLDKVMFTTYADSITADKGKYEFLVDESLIVTIDDGGLNLASGKEYEINGTSVLSSTTLGSNIVNSSLTTLGTIDTGVWNGTTIDVEYGGTGQTSLTSNSVLTGNGTSGIVAESNLIFDGSILTLTGDLSISSSVVDTNGNEYLIFSETASAVNEFTIINNATGSNPIISATGDDSNIGIEFQTKGSGSYHFKSTSSQASTIVLYEDTDNGSNTVSITVPVLGSSYSLTLPVDDGDDGEVLTTNGSGVLSWGSAGGGSLNELSDVTITSADENDILVYSGGAWVDSNSLSLGGTLDVVGDISINSNTIFSESSGTVTLSNIDAIDATTESTLESAIDSLTNLTTVGTITTGIWNGTTIGVEYGGTGQTSLTSNSVLTGNGTSGITSESNLTFDGSILTLTGELSISSNIVDTNGNEYINFSETASAVNEFTITNNATGSNPILSVSGDDANIGIDFQTKGSGSYHFKSTNSKATTLLLYEDTDAGSNTVSITVPNLSDSYSLVLPTTDGINGYVLTTDGNGSLSWTANGSSSGLDDLSDVTLTSEAENEILTYNGSIWVNSDSLSLDGTLNVVGDFSMNSNVVLSESGGTVTLSNIDAIDSTTEATLESAIDSLSNLTTLGTITTGVWNGTTISVAYGGTGQTSLTSNSVLTGNGTSGITAEGNLTFDGSILTLTGDFSISSNIVDTNGNEYIIFSETASAVNEFTITNNSTGNNPIFSATGDDTNIGMEFQSKGTGSYHFKSTSDQASTIVLYEDTDEGSNTVSITVPTLSSSYSLTLPIDDGVDGRVLATDGSGTLSWVTRQGLTIETITSDPNTAEIFYRYLCNTTSSSFNFTLPVISGLSVGDVIEIVDSHGQFDTNSLTIIRSGTDTINEAGDDTEYTSYSLTDRNANVRLVVGSAGRWVMTFTGGSPLLSEFAVLSQQSATTGGTVTAGSWTTRPLNTESDPSGIVSLSSNQFTLGAGTYYIEATSTAFRTDYHQTRIRNVTDGTTSILGTAVNASTLYSMSVQSTLKGTITLTTSKTFEFQHYNEYAGEASSGGVDAESGEDNIHAQVMIQRFNSTGTITNGTWNGSIIGVEYGGTGQSSLTSNSLLTGNGTSGITSETNLTFDGSTLAISGDITMTDNDTLNIGTGNDLQLTHDGTDTTITNGTGQLGIINSDGDIELTSQGTSNVKIRTGSQGFLKTQQTHTDKTSSTGNVNLTASELLSGIITYDADGDYSLNLPSAGDLVSGINECAVGDSFDFYILNQDTSNFVDVDVSGSETLIDPNTNNGRVSASSIGTFRLRLTNVSSGTEDFIVYRLG